MPGISIRDRPSALQVASRKVKLVRAFAHSWCSSGTRTRTRMSSVVFVVWQGALWRSVWVCRLQLQPRSSGCPVRSGQFPFGCVLALVSSSPLMLGRLRRAQSPLWRFPSVHSGSWQRCCPVSARPGLRLRVWHLVFVESHSKRS